VDQPTIVDRFASETVFVPRFPVRQDDGCLLLDFTAGSEDAPNRLDGEIPLTAALVVLRHGPGPLLRADEQKDKRGEVEGQSANEASP
jgi:hypothetical protein